jgi:hypothetical protein
MSGAAFRRSVDVFVARHLSPQAQSAALARVAKEGVAELIRTGRAPPRYTRYVDGREGAPEESVRPDGEIRYRFDPMAEVIAFALAFLRERSPVRTGRYRDSFYLGLDGRFVPASSFNPERMERVSEVTIGNMAPYSRKLSVQMVGGKQIKVSVPPGIFEDAAVAVNRRFGNVVRCKKVYTVSFPGQYILKRGRRAGKPVESPALVIARRG